MDHFVAVFLDDAPQFLVRERWRHLENVVIHQTLGQVAPKGLFGIRCFHSAHVLPDGSLKLLEVLELSLVLGEFVVQVGKLELTNFLEMDGEMNYLSGQVRFEKILRKGQVELLFLVGLHADDLLLETGHGFRTPHMDHIIGAVQVLNRLTAHGAGKIDIGDVTVF